MRKNSPLDALMPRIRQKILIETVSQPERWRYATDLAARIGVTPSSLQRELASLLAADILEMRRDGSRVYYRANPSCPFLPELRGLLTKTAGMAEALRQALEPFFSAIEAAFIFGSVARGEEAAASDIDIFLIGEISLTEIALPLRQAEKQLQREISPVVMTRTEFVCQRAAEPHFLMTVLNSKKIYLKGSDTTFGI